MAEEAFAASSQVESLSWRPGMGFGCSGSGSLVARGVMEAGSRLCFKGKEGGRQGVYASIWDC